MKKIILFENTDSIKYLYPLIYMRPVVDLRLGISTLFEKWQKLLPEFEIKIKTRNYLEKYWQETHPGTVLSDDTPGEESIWIDARIIPDSDLVSKIKDIKQGEGFQYNGETAVVCGSSATGLPSIEQEIKHSAKIKMINYPWELINENSKEIKSDIELFGFKHSSLTIETNTENWLNKYNVFSGEKCRIYPNVVIDAESGPVVIDEGAVIQPFTFIEGPVYIGKNSVVKAGSRILHGTTIGPVCKVSGEISQTVCHSYVNKQHDGFLGNSYLSPWVNLGADTVTSNLKNNYSTIRLEFRDKKIDTGEMFLGLIAGDHLKSGINTMFNTGTIGGCFANVFGGGYTDKRIPSFAWGANAPFAEYDLNKAIETAKIVKARRGIEITDSEEELIRYIFDLTREERGYGK